jgi:hypothetical protein
LGFTASLNRIAYEVMHGKHGMLLGDTKARKVRTFFVLNQLAFEVSQMQEIAAHGSLRSGVI